MVKKNHKKRDHNAPAIGAGDAAPPRTVTGGINNPEDQVVETSDATNGSDNRAPQYFPPKDIQKYLHSKQRDWPRITAIISAIGLAVILAQAIIYYLTLRQVARSADYTEQQATASQVAANAADKSASIAQTGLLPRIEARFVIVTLEQNKKLEIRVELTNKGNTTALNFITQSRLLIPQGEQSEPADPGPPSVSNLGPEMSVGTPVKSSWDISAEVIEAIKGEKVGFRLWSWGTYDDEFGGRAHRFAFCWSYRKEFGTLVHCTREQYDEWKPTYIW